jgi:hypothetical protein
MTVEGFVAAGMAVWVPGAAVMPGNETGGVAARDLLEPELQAESSRLAIRKLPNNLYMMDDLQGDLYVK